MFRVSILVYLRTTGIHNIHAHTDIEHMCSTNLRKLIAVTTTQPAITCSKEPEQRQWHRSGVFIGNFEHISHLVLVFLLITLSM